MVFYAYRLRFTAGVHFGGGSLWDGNSTLPADSFFSALCLEALEQEGAGGIETLVESVRAGNLRLSDLFPYLGDELYLPKPLYPIKKQVEGDSTVKKSFKKLKYIPASQIAVYLQGDLDPLVEVDQLKKLGRFEMRTMIASRSEEKLEAGDALPYQVGVYRFGADSGLYGLAGFEGGETQSRFEALLDGLSYSGIGGKRSAGLGRFTWTRTELPSELAKRLERAGETRMSLSVCMAQPEELEQAMEGAYYLLEKRSGFIASSTYAPEQRKKRDFYAFRAGSCFRNNFDGGIFDVSGGGAHPVYRYAVPLWMEI